MGSSQGIPNLQLSPFQTGSPSFLSAFSPLGLPSAAGETASAGDLRLREACSGRTLPLPRMNIATDCQV
ncbi:hypothetical protein CYA_2451 [Synechococcus sp. JA-3-3Ab]|nr:hypothetical protein CYA_2451 [Synechococcus sp. JA-3-3Ab]